MISPPTRAAWRFVLAAAAAGLCLAAAGCSNQPKVNDSDLVYIETPALAEAMESSKKRVIVVDARIAPRYELAHIPGAINIPLADAVRDDERLKDVKGIIVYALDWEDPIALAMSKKLMALGYKDVQTYRGGLREWIDQGRPTEPPLDAPREDGN